MKIDYWLKMFLENKNISFIKTIIYPLYAIDKYVLCKRLNITFMFIIQNWLKKQKQAFKIEKQTIICF